jgi:adiponectin receptor
MVATSFFPPVYYSFLCSPGPRYTYLIGISFIGLCCIAISLVPTFQTARWRPFRASMFAGMGLAGIIPCLHKLLVLPHEAVVWKTTGLEAAMGALYLIGAVFYSTRIPERWKPGTFDIAGSSHQIFHLFVLAGAFLHYNTGLIYLDWRDSTGCPH